MMRLLRRLVVKWFGDPPDPALERLRQSRIVRFQRYDPELAARADVRARERATRIRRAHRDPP